MSKTKIKHGNFINGKWLETVGKDCLEVFDKYSNESIAKLPLASQQEAEEAITGSITGFETLRKFSAGERADLLQKLFNKLEERKQEITEIIITEAGKPRPYAENEVKRCLSTIDGAITEAKTFSGEMIPMDFGAGAGKTAFTKRFPLGPVLCITPFNFPLNLVLHKVAPAMAVGCSVILKPAPQAPLSSLFLASIMEEVGYPKGAISVLNCDNKVAELMVRDNRIKMLSFTGSEKVGWHLKEICGYKKVALELGGNAAVIIDSDTDLAATAKQVAMGAFLYAGQICISTQRIYVVEPVFEEFKKLLMDETKKIKTGDPSEKDTMSGPLIAKVHLNRMTDWVNEAKTMGAEILVGGKIKNETHNLFEPTLLTNTKKGMKVVDEEAFGPVAIIESVKDFDEAIAQVNDSKFGLQAGVFTNSFTNFKKCMEELEVGGIIMNNVPGFRIDTMPYGGVKMSGLGREGLKYAMDEMTEPRLIVY